MNEYEAIMLLIIGNATLEKIKEAIESFGEYKYEEGWNDSSGHFQD